MKDITLGKAALWPAELAPRFLGSTSKEVAKSTLTVVHGLTYLPLLLLPVLQDVHLKLVVVINTALCLCLMAGNTLFHFMGIVKVFPKMLDMFLLVLYGSMVPVVCLQYAWLADWVNVVHNAAVAAFIGLTIVLPCWDSFATEALRDRLPEGLWDLPEVKAAGLRVSVTWALCLLLCALAALPPALLTARHTPSALHIVCDYVVVLLMIAAGIAMQWRTTVQLLAALLVQISAAQGDTQGDAEHAADLELGDAQVGVEVQPRHADQDHITAHEEPAPAAAATNRAAAAAIVGRDGARFAGDELADACASIDQTERRAGPAKVPRSSSSSIHY